MLCARAAGARGYVGAMLPFLGVLGALFRAFQNDFEKTSKKVRKSRILASQNHPKTFPKPFQNRHPPKHAFFLRFLFDFWCMLQEPTSKKRAPTQCFVSFSHNSVFHFLHAFSAPKTYQKPFRNKVRTLPKSMSKTCRFSTSIFSGFGFDFGGSWASMLKPRWLKSAKNVVWVWSGCGL